MNLLQSRRGRALLFTILYATEGAPIGFIWWALPTLLRAQKIPIEDITALTAALVLPWVFKFLWAPLIDALRSPSWGFRHWIMASQLLMGLTLAPLVYIEPAENFLALAALLMIHTFAAATQDVAIDGLAIRAASAREYGTINGCMQAGMLLGRGLFGGGALLVASRFGWSWIFVCLIGFIWTALALLVGAREPDPGPEPRSSFTASLQRALNSRHTWTGLAFALISAAAFEATGALAGPYLIDRGVTEETIGLFFALPVMVATLIGAILGGKTSDRIGRTRAVGLFLLGFVAAILMLGGVERFYSDAAPQLLLAILLGMYFFIGLFTASSYALFMDLTDPKIGATQFSAFMAATNGCESWSTWAGGRIAADAGYFAAFFIMSAVSLLSLPLLRLLTNRANL
jgi:MFS transporter, PAT family, beta-lactamase induction signal transducer AmpG